MKVMYVVNNYMLGAKVKSTQVDKIISKQGKIVRICPVCGNYYDGYPALSRKDNKTEICTECGMSEAVASLFNSEKNMCIFEDRYCEYANKESNTFGSSFICEAPSDEDMKCR